MQTITSRINLPTGKEKGIIALATMQSISNAMLRTAGSSKQEKEKNYYGLCIAST